MKRLALLHLLLCSTISLFSQGLSQRNQNTLSPTKILDHFEYYTWDLNEEYWRWGFSFDFLYDDNANNTKEMLERRDKISTENMYQYDDNNNLIEKRSHTPNSSLSNIEVYQYDENQNLIKFVRYFIDLETKEKTHNPDILFSYYDNGLIKEEIRVEIEKFQYQYDENGNKTETLKYSWIEADQTYKPGLKSTYTYDNHNNLTYSSDYKIDLTTGKLGEETNSLRYEYTYENDRVVKTIYSMLDKKVLFWELKSEMRYEYDPSGNLIAKTSYNFKNFNTIPSTKSVYTYDLSVDKENISTPVYDVFGEPVYSDTSQFLNQPVSCTRYSWDEETNSWTPRELYNFGYSTLEITSASKENTKLQIYPNPTTDIVNFSIPKSQSDVFFELMDCNGNILFSEILQHMNQISIKELNSGIYFYRISNKTLHQNGKIIKK